MEPKRFFKINCATLDARNVQESTLAQYDKIIANCANVLVTPESRALLDQYGVTLNCAGVLSVPSGAAFSQINGPAEIKPGQALPAEGFALMVNGPLSIAPGSEEILRRGAIHVNGPVDCPESLAGLVLSLATVNGPVRTYPDGCIRLKDTAVLDRTFRLRAKADGHYYAAKKIVALDGDIGFDTLAEKHVRFTTKELLVSESSAGAAVPLFNDSAGITVLPDGCAYVRGGGVLDKAMLRSGGKLYVDGGLIIGKESAPLLEDLNFLRVTGTLYVYRPLVDAVLALDVRYKQLRPIGGTVLQDKDEVVVDWMLLEVAEDGLSVLNCSNVTLVPKLPIDFLRERLLSVADCCSVNVADAAQRAVVMAVAEDVDTLALASDRTDDEEDEVERRLGSLAPFAPLLGVDPMTLTDADIAAIMRGSKFVNAANYEL